MRMDPFHRETRPDAKSASLASLSSYCTHHSSRDEALEKMSGFEPAMDAPEVRWVAVIGAGASGLTTIKQLKDEGLRVVCLEKEKEIGGVFYWAPHKNGVYDSTTLTISNALMSFSDHHEEKRYFMHHSQYLDYLKSYAERYGLMEHIQFGATVTKVAKEEDGFVVEWEVESSHCIQHFDAVAVCTGTHQLPRYPSVTGLMDFPSVFHAACYKNNKPFVDKKVLCIGLGETGADVVREISDVAKECMLALRSLPCCQDRLQDGLHSPDSFTTRSHHSMAPIFHLNARSMVGFESLSIRLYLLVLAFAMTVLSPLMYLVDMIRRSNERVDEFGQKLSHGKMRDLNTELRKEASVLLASWRYFGGNNILSPHKFLTKNTTFVNHILDGKIRVNASGIDAVDGRKVIFNNKETFEPDVIVCCTGYIDRFEFMDKITVPNDDVRNLYKHAFPPDFHGRLAFIGWARPVSGGIPCCSEMVARYFASIVAGRCHLPPDVGERIEREKELEEKALSFSPELHSVVPSVVGFMDGISKEIGCEFQASRYWYHPWFLWKVWAGGLLASQYRLQGPHANPDEATKSIMSKTVTMPSVYVLGFTLDYLVKWFYPCWTPLTVRIDMWRHAAVADEKYLYGYPKPDMKALKKRMLQL